MKSITKPFTAMCLAATFAFATFATFAGSSDAHACVDGAEWTSLGATSAAGAMAGDGVTITSFMSQPILSTADLSGPAYAGAPRSSSEEMLIYAYASPWTATFDTPVEDLLLYARSWRGITGTGIDVQYTFDRPFTILSGFPNAVISGNTLIVPNGSFEHGILQFSGIVSSVSVLNVNSPGGFSQQSMTFGTLRAEPCPNDLDGDCVVDLTDLLALLAAWGPCGDCAPELTGDGVVDLSDLLELLSTWGSC